MALSNHFAPPPNPSALASQIRPTVATILRGLV